MLRIYLAIIAIVVCHCTYAAQYPVIPDPKLTPGAVDPHVTQANIHQTICVHGYTKKVRHVTEAMKRKVYAEYHIKPTPYGFEIDHDISLELGGSNDIRNLWPESYSGAYGARRKDILETTLKHLVCAGKIPLAKAQNAIASDWIAADKRYRPGKVAK